MPPGRKRDSIKTILSKLQISRSSSSSHLPPSHVPRSQDGSGDWYNRDEMTPSSLSTNVTLTPLPTSTTILPDLLPPDLLIILIEHLLDSQSNHTLANLQQTSKTNYDLITPFLHASRTLNTRGYRFTDIIGIDDKVPVEVAEQEMRKSGGLWKERGRVVRSRVHMAYTKELVVDFLPPDAGEPPDKRHTPYTTMNRSRGRGKGPLSSVETVTILPPVLHDLSLFFSAHIVENFLRPLSTCCAPTTLVLRHPDDTALGSHKYLMNLVDELRWPQLRRLVIHNVGAQALPSRPGLDVTINFAPGIPVKWDAGPIHVARQLRKYERSRLTQILMAIPRSVRVREGAEGLEGTRWTFVGAGRFFGENYAQDSTDRLRMAVKEWAQREYVGAGWTGDGVEELLSRIELEV